MPKVAASNGVRPEIRALAVLQLGKTVTPAQINDHVGTGDYAAKYVSFLNTRYGFKITPNKDGRKVVSYTVISEPDNAADLRGMQPKAPKTKAVKAPKSIAKVLNLTKAETGAEIVEALDNYDATVIENYQSDEDVVEVEDEDVVAV